VWRCSFLSLIGGDCPTWPAHLPRREFWPWWWVGWGWVGRLVVGGGPVNSVGTRPWLMSASTPATVALAEHLRPPAVMYSDLRCPHCHEQKEMFGRRPYKHLTIVSALPTG